MLNCVFFSLASGNLQACMRLPWVEEGGQVLFLCMFLAGKRQLYTILRASTVAASQLLDFFASTVACTGVKGEEGIREGLQGVIA